MMAPEDIIQFLASLAANPWILVKFLFLIGLGLYLAFAVIVVRQVKLMSQTLNGLLDIPLRLFSLIHLVVAIVTFILALIIL